MIGPRQADEALGMERGLEQGAGVLHPDEVVGRRMEEQHRHAKPGDFAQEIDRLHPVEELAAQFKRPPADRDGCRLPRADRVEVALDPAQNVRHVRRGADRRHRGHPVEAEIVGRRQHRRPAQAVPDQQDLVPEPVRQVLPGSHEVLHVGGKARPAEFAPLPPSPVKSKRRQAIPSRARARATAIAALLWLVQVKQCANSAAPARGRSAARANPTVRARRRW